jgi:NitT/TauT family transport system permease protein
MSHVASHSSELPESARDREQALHERVWQETRRRSLYEHTGVAVGRALFIGAVLLLWGYASGRWIDHQTISDPVSVLQALYHLIETGRLWPNLWQTVLEVVAGYVFGAFVAVLVASLFAIFPSLEQAMRPVLIAIYSIPKVALAPLIIMWFGLGIAPKIILAGGFVFFIVFMNLIAGIESVNRNHVNIVRVMGAGRMTILRKIVLPTAVPFLFLGLRLAIPEAMIGAVIGEFISGSQGLGFLVYSASNELNTAVSMAALVVLVMVVAAGDALLGLWERLFLPRQLQQADLRAVR